ncbi:hypothetical protein [Micromonospora sp. NPDC048843]|uniref:hypothetical protein n=1 Tax=Micromonospora sp. NPDC048843 TaxID=3155389 RepID=UPI0033EEBA09
MRTRSRVLATAATVTAVAVVGMSGPAQAVYIDWDIYKNYASLGTYTCGSNPKASVPLRYGGTGAGGFGLYHIEEGHGDFTSTDSANVAQTLAYGQITHQTNQQTYRHNMGGQGTWRVVVSTRCDSPQDQSINGVITAFRE